jgi:hypothetical protein
VNGVEFIRRLQQLARVRGVALPFVPDRGKGSPGTLHFGSRYTVLKDRRKEIGIGLLRSMCKDLGVDPREL